MTTEGASFLFGGTHFDRKRFAADFALFQVKKKEETNDSKLAEAAESEPEEEEEAVEKQVKKRKRKTDASSEAGDGISLFKKSKSVKEDKKEKEKPANERAKEKKKLNKQLERDSLLRKKHNIHVSGTNIPSPLESFSDLKSRFGCEEYLLRNLAELGFEEPTPIQRQAIPILLSGRECFACAPTGSGKTFAFVVPMLMKLKHASKDGVRAVILCPTRELAAQTARECKKLSDGNEFNIKCMTKELVKKADFSKHPCDVLISTPRRLQMLINKKRLDLSRVEYLVLDESDKLFELGLLKQIDSVVKECSNPSIVRSLFSATLPDFVEELARTIMHDAVRVIIGRKNTASETIKQKLVYTGSEQGKFMALRQTFTESLNPPVLVFVQNKERAKELYGELLARRCC